MSMKLEKTIENVPGANTANKQYRSPKLAKFGRLRELTASGTKTGTENQGNMDGSMT